MRLLSLDLNLLAALHALLEEQHVTRAGQRIGLSQSAASDALRRLRRHFDDELLVRNGNRYELTPLALVLRARAAEAVEKIELTFAARAESTSPSDRTYRLYATGNGIVNFVRPFLDNVRNAGTDLKLRVFDLATLPGAVADSDDMLREPDGVLSPRDFAGNHPTIELYRDAWTVVSARGRDVKLTLADLSERPWVIPFDYPQAYSPALTRLHTLGVAPRTDVVVEDFLSIAYMVTESDRLSVLPKRLAAKFPDQLDIHDECFGAPEMIESFWWHPVHTADPEHVWFRKLLTDFAAQMAEDEAAQAETSPPGTNQPETTQAEPTQAEVTSAASARQFLQGV